MFSFSVGAVEARLEVGLDGAHLLPEGIHVDDEVLDDRQVPHRGDHRDVAVRDEVGDPRLAGEHGAAVDAHAARAADHHPAALAVRERAVDLVLHDVERVEQRRLVGDVDLVRPERALAGGRVVAPDLQLDLHAGSFRSSLRVAPSGHPNPPPAANSIGSVAEKSNENCANSVPNPCHQYDLTIGSHLVMRTSRYGELRRAVDPRRDRVLHEVLVVALGEVGRARVGAARLLARDPGLEHAGAEVEQVAELDRLGQVAVEDGALVLDHDAAVVPPPELVDDPDLLLHLVRVAEDAEVLEHRLAELVADLPRPLAVLDGEEAVHPGLGVGARSLGVPVRRRGAAERVLGRVPARASPERDRLHQRVAAEAVRAVDGDARDLAGGVEALERGQPPLVRLDAAHVVVGAGPHRDRREDRVDAGVRHRELARAGELVEDLLRPEVPQVEHDRAVDAAARLDLGRLRAGDDVARGQLERVRRVALHEALAVLVDQVAALAPAALGDQDPRRVHRRRVELHELHVLQRQAGAERHRHPVAGTGVGVRRRAVEAAGAAGREDRRRPGHRLHAAVQQVPADDARAAAVLLDEPEREVLLEDDETLVHPLLQLLVEHLDEDVARDVRRVDGARRAGGAERALVELALGVPREDAAPALELVDVARRLAREDLDRVLVAEVVGALDGVERVRLGVVVRLVAERRVDAALGRARVAARRVELRDDRDACARVVGLDRGAHACAAGADDEHVEGRPSARKLSDAAARRLRPCADATRRPLRAVASGSSKSVS